MITRRSALSLLGAAALGVPLAGARAASPLPAGLFGGPFELMDHTGQTRRDTDFRGRHMLIYFGYTYCPDICPTDLSIMTQALAQLPEPAEQRIQPLFVTVDPARDQPDLLAEYVANFHPRLIGLTGSETQVAAVAKSYRVHRRKVLAAGDDPEDYLVSHSSLMFLMGPEGDFLTMYPHDSDPDFIAQSIESYMKNLS